MGSLIDNRKRAGDFGEVVAKGFLVAKGYFILEMKYKRGSGEIDIIAKYNEYIVFVEVKYRKSLSAGLPREAVTKTKQKSLINAAMHYISENEPDENTGFRFDVVEIFGREQLTIDHIENAFGLS